MSIEKIPEITLADKKKVYRYTYKDNSDGGKVIFECETENISQADDLYRQATGKDPAKQNYVGCALEKIDK